MPEIYVTDLAAYNDGKMHGAWMDAAQDVEDIEEEIKEMLKESPMENAEEWEIHDSEGFGNVDIQRMSLDEVTRLAKGIKEYGEAFTTFYEYTGDIDTAEKEFQDAYEGEYDSEEDFAYEFMNDVYEIPEFIAPYVDYEKLARDLMISDFWSESTEKGRVYIFRRY
ncbi:MAG TPA: antirestriction protein ArdA [Fervidobacterium sp.]|nr:antirestriction protein ArdA [Fervidobacterium sp.]